MDKLHKLLFALLTLALFLPACTEDSGFEQATLELSERQVVFAKAASSQSVTIQTNQTEWTYYCAEEGTTAGKWLTLTQEGNNLLIAATENPTAVERASVIMINAGGVQKRIEVKQAAADANISFNDGQLNVAKEGGKFSVDIDTNGEEWSVEPQENYDWLSFVAKPKRGVLELNVLPNETKTDRTAVLLVKSGAKMDQITVTQLGGNLTFLVPWFNRNELTAYDIVNYEARRKVVLYNIEFALPQHGDYSTNIKFTTPSEIYHFLEYRIDVRSNKIHQIKMMAWNFDKGNNTEFKDALRANGFELKESKSGFTGESAEKEFRVEAIKGEGGRFEVVFTPIVIQKDKYPTFTAFPYNGTELLLKNAWKYEQVKAAELKKGNVIAAEGKATNPDYKNEIEWITFTNKVSTEAQYAQTYVFEWSKEAATDAPAKLGLVSEYMNAYENIHLAMWNAEGEYRLTKEFLGLLNAEGFIEVGKENGTYMYYNMEKDICVVIRVAAFPEILDGKPVLALNYFHMNASPSHVASIEQAHQFWKTYKLRK